jgi:hypothetical protein
MLKKELRFGYSKESFYTTPIPLIAYSVTVFSHKKKRIISSVVLAVVLCIAMPK